MSNILVLVGLVLVGVVGVAGITRTWRWWNSIRESRDEIVSLRNARAGLELRLGEAESRDLNQLVTSLTSVKANLEQRVTDISERLAQLRPQKHEIPSSHPMLEVMAVRTGQGLLPPTVSALSQACKEFFGLKADVSMDRLIGTPASALMANLKSFIDPPASYWDDLEQDQIRVYNDYISLRQAIARYPVLFNRLHPIYPNRSFIPLVVDTREGKRGRDGAELQYTTVLYLDTSKIPGYVFRRELWEMVKGDLNVPDLGMEIEKLIETRASKVSKGGAADITAFAEITALKEALEDVKTGASFKVIECCARVGFFSLEQEAQKCGLAQLRELVQRILNA
jgi:hypothetical protein